MAYVNFNKDAPACWTNGIHTGKYKDRKAFIEIINNEVRRIVLEDATHFFGESLAQIEFNELFIYVLIRPDEQEAKRLQEKDAIIQTQWNRINKYAAEEDENRRHRILTENVLKEKQQRHNAQLRSIFYMLEQVENIGTHREKAIVVNYLRKCIYGFLKEDGLDKYGMPDDLPF